MKNVSKLFFLSIVLLSMLNTACEKENRYDLSNPADELPWLKNMIKDFDEYVLIYSANYQGQTVFVYHNCNPLINYYPAVYDCNGDIIASANEITDELSYIEVIWQHQDSECVLSD